MLEILLEGELHTVISTVHFIELFKDFQQYAPYTCNSKVLTQSS